MTNENMISSIEYLLGCKDEIKLEADKIIQSTILDDFSKSDLSKKLGEINSLIIDLYIKIREAKIILSDHSNPEVQTMKQYLVYYEAFSYKYLLENKVVK